ncbi:zinc finger CCHC domain-containing protein 7-like [Saccoglossus kowalevskii]|uniref:Zinc finger CCHC domain-containing protein 7-like n=1 Tax=Saccoglossus kowalevskii TaxID=10224 RepID=A0ABM0MSB8_SACKO|nr:PREDICTED: zinc finger CCHC domain-containing protein 7-like [Saccoglossus kowalevskii]
MQTMYDSLEDYERDIYGLGSDSDSGDDAEKKNIECQLYQQMHYAQTSDEVDNDYTITPSDAVKLSAADSDSVVFLKSTHVPKKRKSEVIFISSDSDVQPSKKRKEEHFASLAPISETSLEQSDCKIKLDHLQMKKNKKSNKFAKKSKFRKGKESSSTPTIRISSDEESVAEWTVIDDITDPQPDLMMNVTNMWSSQQTSKTSKDWKIELEDKMNNIQNSEKKSKSHHKRYYASKSSIRCHKCGECGHLSKYCTQPRVSKVTESIKDIMNRLHFLMRVITPLTQQRVNKNYRDH